MNLFELHHCIWECVNVQPIQREVHTILILNIWGKHAQLKANFLNISISVTSMGNYDATFQKRGCINITALKHPSDFKCAFDGDQQALHVVTDQLSLNTPPIYYVNVFLNWACFCNDDLCTPEHCDPGDIQIGESWSVLHNRYRGGNNQ